MHISVCLLSLVHEGAGPRGELASDVADAAGAVDDLSVERVRVLRREGSLLLVQAGSVQAVEVVNVPNDTPATEIHYRSVTRI